jgi:Rha family phage regulatory protein
MTELILAGSEEKKMSSLEISELMGKKHMHVMRDIRALIDAEAVTESNFGLSEYRDASGKANPMYLLDFEATMTLITGYDAKRRSVVIKRWHELEKKEAATPAIDPIRILNDPAAMRGLLLTYSEKVISLEATVTAQAPKVAALDRISTADGFLCITDTAKALQIRPKDLFAWLSANTWIYRRAGGKGWIAYQPRLQQGVLSHKVTTVERTDGTEKVVEQVLVTPKGVSVLAESFPTAKRQMLITEARA